MIRSLAFSGVLCAVFCAPRVASALSPPERGERVDLSGWGSAPAGGRAVATAAAVRGPVQLQVRTTAADVEIMVGAMRLVTVRVTDGDAVGVTLQQEGANRYVVLFNGQPALRCGKICVAVPSHSELDVVTQSGNVTISKVEGNVKVRTATGELRLDNVGNVEARTITGDVVAEAITGTAHIDTVSGDLEFGATGTASPRLRFATTSGDLRFTGACGADCRIEAKSLSGDLAFHLAAASSFDVHFLSHSGEIDDAFKLALKGTRPPRETNLRARHGRGEGSLEVQTFSGDLVLAGAVLGRDGRPTH